MLVCGVPLLLCVLLALLVWREQVVQHTWTHYRLRVGRDADQAALEAVISDLLMRRGGGSVWTVAEAPTDLAVVLAVPGTGGLGRDLHAESHPLLSTTPLHVARLRTMQLPNTGTWRTVGAHAATPDWRGDAVATVTRVTATGTRHTWALDPQPADSWRRGGLRLPVRWTVLATTWARLTARTSATPLLPPVATTRGMQIPPLPPCGRTLPVLPGPHVSLGFQHDGTPWVLPLDQALRLQLVGAADRTMPLVGHVLTTLTNAGAAGLALLTPEQADSWLTPLPATQRARVQVLDSRVWGTTASLDVRVLPDPVLAAVLGDLAGLDGADSARWLLPSVLHMWRTLPQGQVTDLIALLCDPPQTVCAAAGYSALDRRIVGVRWAERLAPLVTRTLLCLLAQPGIVAGDVWQAGGLIVLVLPDAPAERTAWGQLARALLLAYAGIVERPLVLVDGAARVPAADTLPVGQIRVHPSGERLDGWWTLLTGGCSPSKSALALAAQGLHPLSIAFLPPDERVMLVPDVHGPVHLTADRREPAAAPACLTRHAGSPTAGDPRFTWACQQVLAGLAAVRQRMPLVRPTQLTATSDTPDAITITAQWDDSLPPQLPGMLREQLARARQCVSVRATALGVTLPHSDTAPLRVPLLWQRGTERGTLHAVPWESLGVALLGGAAWEDTAAAVVGQLLSTTDPDRVRLHLLGTLPESLAVLTTVPHMTPSPHGGTAVGGLRQVLTDQMEPDADGRTPLVVLVLDDAALADRLLLPTVRQVLERGHTKPFWLLLLAPVSDSRLGPLMALVPLIGGTPGAMRMRRPGQAPQSLPCAAEQPLALRVADLPPRHHLPVAVLAEAATFWGTAESNLAPSLAQVTDPTYAGGALVRHAVQQPPAETPSSLPAALPPAPWTWTPEIIRAVVHDALHNTSGRRQLRFRMVLDSWERMDGALTKPTEADFASLLDTLAEIVESRPNTKTAYIAKDLSEDTIWAVVAAHYPALAPEVIL